MRSNFIDIFPITKGWVSRFHSPRDLQQAAETGLKPADLIQRRVKPSRSRLIARAEEIVVIEFSMKPIVG